jgi:hypothetical protein
MDKNKAKEIVEKILNRKTKNTYPNEVQEILNTISYDVKKTEVLGSMSLRSQLYASDYDCFEVVDVNNISEFERKFKSIVRECESKSNYYLGDIKIGEARNMTVIDQFLDKRNYKPDVIKSKLKRLHDEGKITSEEYNEGLTHIKENPSDIEFIKMKRELRYNILRWKPKEILNGSIDFRGEKITLKNALLSGGLVKLDLIVRLDNGNYQEFSIIYDIRIKGKRVGKPMDFVRSIKDSITEYFHQEKYFKMCKRLFSYWSYMYRYKGKSQKSMMMLKKLYKILNSDLGIIYQVIGDLDVLIYLLEHHNKVNIDSFKNESDRFKNKLANVYSSSLYLKNEKAILKKLDALYSMKSMNKKTVYKTINDLKDKLNLILNKETGKFF